MGAKRELIISVGFRLESPFLQGFKKGDNKGVVASHVVYPLQTLQALASTVLSLP